MKQTLILILLITGFAFGQSSRSELSNSKIYLKATYFDKVNKNIGLQIRTDLTDTLISKINYKKFLLEEFTDSKKKIKVFFTKLLTMEFLHC